MRVKNITRSQVKLALASVLLATATTSALAASPRDKMNDEIPVHEHCSEGGKWTYMPGMGMVNEDKLQAHIDEMSAEIDRAQASTPRSNQQRKSMERHLAKMEQTMRDMHASLTDDPCGKSVTGMPVDQRILVLEKRLDSMQKLVEQLIKRQAEMERQ